MPIQCEEKNYKHSVFLILQKIWKKISKKNIFLKNWTFKNKLGHAHKYQTHFYEVLGNWPSFSLFISNILVAKTGSITKFLGAIALLYPPLSYYYWWLSWKNAAESFAVALTLTLGGYESAIAPIFVAISSKFLKKVLKICGKWYLLMYS